MQRVTRLLQGEGPLTIRDIARELGITPDHARGAIGKARASGQVHIAGYRRDSDGGRLYPRALWAAGQGVDAKKPPPLTELDYNRRHRQRKTRAISSVWQLGTPVDDRRVGRGA